MPKQTLQHRYIEALKNRGGEEVVSKSSKYKTLLLRISTAEWPYAKATLFFVGKSGSVRWGRTFTESIPLSDKMKISLLGET